MLSIILYGRNDNHGHNYHKRLAISLNCLAEMLSHPHDEIIYTDYNTPDELPTVIEAIQDTLTTKAKSLIRILRVRPSHHHRFASQTSLPLIEPVARNVAIRRSNPENKWVLSTNADMIFISQKPEETLSDIVSETPDGFFSLPRLEIPERFWESALRRSDPIENISFLKAQYKKLHLNSYVRQTGFLQFDNPGDFQLMLRNHIFQIGGFDEGMLQGWHVDSNLAKRMSLLLGEGKSLEDRLMAFHCNHTQQISLLHSRTHLENDWNNFVNNEAISPICSQKDWGLANDDVEEISLSSSPSRAYVDAISSSIVKETEGDYEFLLHMDSFNTLTYSSSRIFIFLADHLATLPKTVNIGYFGYNTELLCLLDRYLDKIKFEGKILCPNGFLDHNQPLPSSVILSEFDELISQAFIFIFDFGFDETSVIGKTLNLSSADLFKGRKKTKKVMGSFFDVVKRKKIINSHTKFIGINVNHTDFNTIFFAHLSVRINSFITGVSYGYLVKNRKPISLSGKGLKKRIALALHYLVVRYLFNYSNQIRRFVLRTRISSIFKKC